MILIKNIIHIVCFLGFAFYSNGQSPYALIGTDKQAAGPIGWFEEAELSEKMQRIMEAWAMDDEFSGAILISNNGEVIYRGAFGLADRSFDISNTTNTKFRIGYMAFHFTQYAIAKWVMEGKFNLEDAINQHIPELSAAHFDKITLRHLLTSHSGLNEGLEGLVDVNRPHTLIQLIEVINKEPRVAEPGSRYSFGWSSFVILAKLVENLSKESYQGFIQRNIIDPLGLKNTGFSNKQTVIKKLAKPYVSIFGEKANASEVNYWTFGPQTSMYSTIDDLNLFYNHLTDFLTPPNALIKEAMDIRTFGILDNKLTMKLEEIPRDKTFDLLDMNGWFSGYTSLLTCLTNKKTMIIVLSNTFRASEIYDIRRRFIRGLYDLPMGLPLPKTKNKIWELLEKEGVEATSKYYKKLVAQGLASLPLRDEFMFLCREMRKQHQFDKALEVSKMFVAIDDGWVAYRELGEIYRLLGKKSLAKENFKKSLALNPDNANWKAAMENYILKN